MRAASWLGVVLCAFASMAHAASGADLDTVFQLLAQRQHGHVQFVEQHFLKMLDRPVESSGEMRFDAPAHLEKRTLQPRQESLVLDNGVITVDKGRVHKVMDLSTVPQMEPFIESIRATLAGDRAALERLFMLSFDGSVAKWTLTLLPREPKVKRSVQQVRIEGARDQLSRVEIRQADGDRSLLTLRPAPTP